MPVKFRRIGWAWARQPSWQGWDVYGVYGTRPGQLAAQYAGWIDNGGAWHPASPEWLERYGTRDWLTREWYHLKLDGHEPVFHADGLLECSCGFERKLGNAGLARLEFVAHTSELRPVAE